MKPVRVKTVQVKAGQVKLASAGSAQPATPITSAIPAARPEVPETSSAVMARAETNKVEVEDRSRQERNAAATGKPRHRQRCARRPPRIEFAFLLHLAGDGLRRSNPRPEPAGRFGRTAPPSRSPPAPYGSFRSAHWKAKTKRCSALTRRAVRPAVCWRRPTRLPSRSSPRATGSCSGPALPASIAIRPSGVPDAKTLRHLLHHRSQLIHTTVMAGL